MTNQPIIELRNVTKMYGSTVICENLNLTVNRGETVVIFGPGGCGKTTLLKICEGLVKPDSGQVIIDGQDITQLREARIDAVRQRCGMLFQYYALFDSMTVEENVGFFLSQHRQLRKTEITEHVNKYLAMVNLTGTNKLKPLELSGGMQKRVGIARALIHEPSIVFYDSPTDGLDPVTAEVINDLIIELNRASDATALVISNDMNTVFKIGTRVGMMYRGVILELLTPDELRSTREPHLYQFIHGLEEGPIGHE